MYMLYMHIMYFMFYNYLPFSGSIYLLKVELREKNLKISFKIREFPWAWSRAYTRGWFSVLSIPLTIPIFFVFNSKAFLSTC